MSSSSEENARSCFFPFLSWTRISTFRSASSSTFKQFFERRIPSSKIFNDSSSGRSPFSNSPTMASNRAIACSNFTPATAISSYQEGIIITGPARLLNRRVRHHFLHGTAQLSLGQTCHDFLPGRHLTGITNHLVGGNCLHDAVPTIKNSQRTQIIQARQAGSRRLLPPIQSVSHDPLETREEFRHQ